MNTTLVTDALSKVWCNPYQDTQFIIQPAKITNPAGVSGTVNLLFDTVNLPTPTETYHVYQMGQIDPQYLNLNNTMNVWQSATELMRTRKLLMDIYTARGMMVPRFEAWVLYYNDRNLVLAVRDQKPRYDLGSVAEPLFMRLYSNAWYQTVQGSTAPGGIYAAGKRLSAISDAQALQTTALPYQSLTGALQWFLNGKYVDNVPPARVAIGDTVEFVFDASVKEVVEFAINNLETFESTLDAKFKYLLHRPKPTRSTIDYRDDIDVFVVQPLVNTSFEGLYVHKNQDDALRQLTQQDYSVPVSYLAAYQNDQPTWPTLTGLKLRLFIRNSGYTRPLVFEAGRIQELYKLTDTQIVQAMIGTGSNVDFWQAANLESSAYTQLMGARHDQVTQQAVQDAYGYNAISKLCGDTPQMVVNTTVGRGVTLPYDLQTNSTVYEYNSNRMLLGIYPHTNGRVYYPTNVACVMIEAVVGVGSHDTGIIINPLVPDLNLAVGNRLYVCDSINGEMANNWTDITGKTEWYILGPNGEIVWQQSLARFFVAIKSDDKFLSYQFNLTPTDDLLTFNVEGDITFPSGKGNGRVEIEPGALDIWLNGARLIETLDYVVKWPTVVICNKSHWVEGTQLITVRATGFCNSDMTRPPLADVGFVSYGLLSRNRTFDIRDDKVMRIVVGGKLYLQSELVFSEDHNGLQLAGIPNGTPYALEEIVVPLRDAVNTDTYVLRDAARLRDRRISRYLSPLVLDTPIVTPNAIPQLYSVFSPFVAKVMWDLKNGIIPMTNFMGLYSDNAVRDALASYTWLLDFDPTIVGYDPDYVQVVAHPRVTEVTLSIYQLRFLTRAIKTFLNVGVNLSHYVTLSATGL